MTKASIRKVLSKIVNYNLKQVNNEVVSYQEDIKQNNTYKLNIDRNFTEKAMNNLKFVLDMIDSVNITIDANNVNIADVLNTIVQHNFQQAHDEIVAYQNDISEDVSKSTLALDRQFAEKALQNLEFVLKQTKVSQMLIYNINYAYGDVSGTSDESIDTVQDTLDDALDLIQKVMMKSATVKD